MDNLSFFKEGTPLFFIKSRVILRNLVWVFTLFSLFITLGVISDLFNFNPGEYIEKHKFISIFISLVIVYRIQIFSERYYGYYFSVINNEIYYKKFGSFLGNGIRTFLAEDEDFTYKKYYLFC